MVFSGVDCFAYCFIVMVLGFVGINLKGYVGWLLLVDSRLIVFADG